MNKYALISLSDKSNLEKLLFALEKEDYRFIATTSTAKVIKDLGFACLLVEDVTEFPEMLDGRVKTLQPQIHGGILADLDKSTHLEDLKKHNIKAISLVVCNLYPFEKVLSKELDKLESLEKTNDVKDLVVNMHSNLIENIDIGGVTLIRAAAKNYKHVSLLISPDDYDDYINKLIINKCDEAYRKKLATKGFIHTANYDSAIANYFMGMELGEEEKIQQLLLSAPLNKKLRYGENPYQSAFYFESNDKQPYSLASSKIIQGKELSYNNILDIDAAYQAVVEFQEPCAIAIKHNTICGIGFDQDINIAYEKCYNVDSKSIFGGIVILNQRVEVELAKKMCEIFLEIIIAPDFSDAALLEFKNKKNLRIIKGDFSRNNYSNQQLRSVNSGYLFQYDEEPSIKINVVTKNSIDDNIQYSLVNLYNIVKNVKSNAIVIGQDDKVLGICGGMVSRIDACDFALKKTVENVFYDLDNELFLASDAFFPFNDIVDLCLKYNIKYIIQPGGSLNDEKLIEECNKHNINMIFTGIRYFKH